MYPLADVLVRDRLVEREQLGRWSENKLSSDGIVVRGFGDPFAVDFSHSNLQLWVARGEMLHSVIFRAAFDRCQRMARLIRSERVARCPYTGEHG